MKEESLFGYIYAIDLPKGVKIGYSKTPEKRIERIKIANGVSCAKHFVSGQVFKPRSVERSIHLSLAKFRGVSEFFLLILIPLQRKLWKSVSVLMKMI